MKIKKTTLAAIFALATVSGTAPLWGTDEVTAKQAVTEAHLTPTKIGGSYTEYGFLRCGFDLFVTNFEAKTQDGTAVKGIVCSNPVFKGTTIQIDGMRT